MELAIIRDRVEQAAIAITTLPPGKRAEWIVCLLKALQEKTEGGSYKAMLSDTADSLDFRIENGRW